MVSKGYFCMSMSVKSIQNIVAYVRKPAESILSTRRMTAPIKPAQIKYAGAKAQEEMPFVYKIHNGELKRLYPQELQRCDYAMSDIADFQLKGLKTTANFNVLDLQEFYSHLKHQNDIKAFTFVSLGVRPAMATTHSWLFSKIKVPNFDTLTCKYLDDITFFFNKKAALENIHRNKSFYTQRLNLPKNVSDDDIYKILTGENSPLKNYKERDLIGMIMGFPYKNNLIFKLEDDARVHLSLRKNPEKFKEALIKELHSPNCIYAKFDDAFKKDLEDSIKSITTVRESADLGLPFGYTFINFVDETPEIVRINKKIREAIPELEKINAANQKAKDDEFLRSLTADPQKELDDFIKSLQSEADKQKNTVSMQNIMDDFFRTIQKNLDAMAKTREQNSFDSVI